MIIFETPFPIERKRQNTVEMPFPMERKQQNTDEMLFPMERKQQNTTKYPSRWKGNGKIRLKCPFGTSAEAKHL